MIGPFPHAAAEQARVLMDRFPVFFQAAGAVAHRVRVFAQKERARVVLFPFGDKIRHRRVHSAD